MTTPRRTPATEALHVVAIGDSLLRGFRLGLPAWHRSGLISTRYSPLLRWFDHTAQGYAWLAAQRLAADGVSVVLDTSLTCSGAPTTAFWRTGAPVPAVRDRMAGRVDVILLSLGANDLLPHWADYALASLAVRATPRPLRGRIPPATGRRAPPAEDMSRAVRAMEVNLTGLVGWLHRHSGARRIVVTTYYNPDESRVVDERFVGPVNARIRGLPRRFPRVRVADTEPLFAGHGALRPAGARWVSVRDGLHPNRVGRSVIGAVVHAAVLSP